MMAMPNIPMTLKVDRVGMAGGGELPRWLEVKG